MNLDERKEGIIWLACL